MFVSKRRYQQLVARFNRLIDEKNQLISAHSKLIAQWNHVVEDINTGKWIRPWDAARPLIQTPQFTPSELKTLIQLCHPDKHDGKKSAVEITQKLLTLR
jgi:hypothetical protein